MKLLKGLPVATAIKERVQQMTKDVIATYHDHATLAGISNTQRPDTLTYSDAIKRAAQQTGIQYLHIKAPQDTNYQEFVSVIHAANKSLSNGIIVFRPTQHQQALKEITPDKDVDGSTRATYTPCAAEAVIKLLHHYAIRPAGNVLLIGKGNSLGKPLEAMLSPIVDVTTISSREKTKKIAELSTYADLIITASTNKPEFLTPDMIKEGAVIIDAAIHAKDGDIKGDAHPDLAEKASALAPARGGISPITTATLLEHTVQAAAMQFEAARLTRR